MEILVLRQQLRVLRRKSGRPKFTAGDRILLAAASRVLPRPRWVSFLVTPQTLLRWHRTLVRRKWTYGKERTPGRPPIDPQIADLIVRMARENARWGCMRICGELRKLGIRVGATTIRTLHEGVGMRGYTGRKDEARQVPKRGRRPAGGGGVLIAAPLATAVVVLTMGGFMAQPWARWAAFALATPAQFWVGWSFLHKAARRARRRTATWTP